MVGQSAGSGGAGRARQEERLRGRLEARFLLDDLRARYKDAAVLRYEVADYQLPLLAANA